MGLDCRSVALVCGDADSAFAGWLGGFLEMGGPVRCSRLAGPRESFFGRVEDGLNSDFLVLLLSDSSSPAHWPREVWEPLLSERGAGVVLVGECRFPALLRRRNFFDATAGFLAAARGLKRWMGAGGNSFDRRWSGDLEALYAGLADAPGTLSAPGLLAERFAAEASGDFEAVVWACCEGRSVAQTAGEAAVQLGLAAEGTAEENCRMVRAVLEGRRCLLVLDGPQAAHLALAPGAAGRSSVLLTAGPVRRLETPRTLGYARELLRARRFAEAYELLGEMEGGKREIVQILEQWDRLEEADRLRGPREPWKTEQLALF